MQKYGLNDYIKGRKMVVTTLPEREKKKREAALNCKINNHFGFGGERIQKTEREKIEFIM